MGSPQEICPSVLGNPKPLICSMELNSFQSFIMYSLYFGISRMYKIVCFLYWIAVWMISKPSRKL